MLKRIAEIALNLIAKWRHGKALTLNVGSNSSIKRYRITTKARNIVSIGRDCKLNCRIDFDEAGGEVVIGDRVYIGRSSIICHSRIVVGSDVIMSWGVTIVDHDSHSLSSTVRSRDVLDWGRRPKSWSDVSIAPVIVCDKVWVGFDVAILKGVTIGEGAVVGACSVVTRDVEPYSIVAGNPARVIRLLESEDERR